MFDVNVLIVCITVLLVVGYVATVAFACVDKVCQMKRPRSISEIFGRISSNNEDDGR